MAVNGEISAVTLDFWNTLFADPPNSNGARVAARIASMRRALADLGVRVDEERLRTAHARVGLRHALLHRAGLDEPHHEHVAGYLDEVEPGLAARLGPQAVAALADRYGGVTLDFPPIAASEHLADLLTSLKTRGQRLGLISNTGRTPGSVLRTVLRQAGVLALFDTLTFSDEVSLAKPNPLIFQRTLAELGVAPEQTVHVGDDATLDVAGAHAAGMRAIQVTAHVAAYPDEAPDLRIATLDELPDALERLR